MKKILITGATGLVGSELCLALLKKGWSLVVLGRATEQEFKKKFTLPCEYFQWADPAHTAPPEAALQVDCAVNLMGEPIADKRWSDEQKIRLKESRISATQHLVTALNQFNPGLKAFVSTSAIGYYGDGGDAVLSEQSAASGDFLGTLCRDWELAAQQTQARCVIIRTGIVLSHQGGALAKMVPVFEKGLGGKLASGGQWMSWIHIKDLVNIYISAVENEGFRGVYNAVAPEPVTNAQFTAALAGQLNTAAFLPVPRFALDFAMGEMSQMLLGSQRVIPKALQVQGFVFQFQKLDLALGDLFAWKQSCHDRLFYALQWVPRTRKAVFPFFSDVKNLEILTPDFLSFRVLKKSTEQVQSDTEIDYQLKIHGVPVRWRSKICDWQPGKQFRDIQLKGPYKKWDHTHGFEDLAGGTLLTDRVVYRLPLDTVGGGLLSPMIEKDIRKIFNFRRLKIQELFGDVGAASSSTEV